VLIILFHSNTTPLYYNIDNKLKLLLRFWHKIVGLYVIIVENLEFICKLYVFMIVFLWRRFLKIQIVTALSKNIVFLIEKLIWQIFFTKIFRFLHKTL